MPHRDYPLSAASEVAAIVSTLMKSRLQSSSLPTYKRAWKLYNQFLHSTFHGVSMALPIPPPNLALFIVSLFDNHYAPSTVSTYVSALGYSHKLSEFPDPSQTFFLLSKCLKVTVNLEPAWTVGCQLLCQFCIKSLQPLPGFHVQNIKSVSFKPCARLLSMPFLELVK